MFLKKKLLTFTDDPRNIFQEYVPYGVKKPEKDDKESILKAIKDLTPAKYPVVRNFPSLHKLSEYVIYKQVPAKQFDELEIPHTLIDSLKQSTFGPILKG